MSLFIFGKNRKIKEFCEQKREISKNTREIPKILAITRNYNKI